MNKTDFQVVKIKTYPEPVQELKTAVAPERWEAVKDVIEVLQKAMANEWNWSSNTRCKYIGLTIDMRGHSCQIKDREGVVITIQKLKHQLNLRENK